MSYESMIRLANSHMKAYRWRKFRNIVRKLAHFYPDNFPGTDGCPWCIEQVIKGNK